MSFTRPTVVVAVASIMMSLAAIAHALPVRTSYRNCTALHQHYPHGVGRQGAHDRVRGHTAPVTNFTRNTATYNQNRGLDRDGDGVACEQR